MHARGLLGCGASRRGLAGHGEVLRARDEGELLRAAARAGGPSAAQRRTVVAGLAVRLGGFSKAAASSFGLWAAIAAAGLVVVGGDLGLVAQDDPPASSERSDVAVMRSAKEPEPTVQEPAAPATPDPRVTPMTRAPSPEASKPVPRRTVICGRSPGPCADPRGRSEAGAGDQGSGLDRSRTGAETGRAARRPVPTRCARSRSDHAAYRSALLSRARHGAHTAGAYRSRDASIRSRQPPTLPRKERESDPERRMKPPKPAGGPLRTITVTVFRNLVARLGVGDSWTAPPLSR